MFARKAVKYFSYKNTFEVRIILIIAGLFVFMSIKVPSVRNSTFVIFLVIVISYKDFVFRPTAKSALWLNLPDNVLSYIAVFLRLKTFSFIIVFCPFIKTVRLSDTVQISLVSLYGFIS